jgi:hypothetical protein
MKTAVLFSCAALLFACGDDDGIDDATTLVSDAGVSATRIFASDPLPGCVYASPIEIESRGERFILAISNEGTMAALDPESGEAEFTLQVPSPEGSKPLVLSTPAVLGEKLIVAFQNVSPQSEGDAVDPQLPRGSHRVVAFDLEARTLDPELPELIVEASAPAWDGGEVELDSRFQLQRSAVIGVTPEDSERGLAYVAFGNGPSRQPFHGWVLELDLDAWQRDVADAISGVLLTTPDNECEGSGVFSDAMVCGGGVWTPAGPLLLGDPSGDYSLIVPTGNGRVDFPRDDYAHALLRVERGLELEPGCDDALCEDFDPLEPDHACLASCENVFIPRLLEGQAPLAPDNGVCDGLSFFECYGELDADFGSGAPALVRMPDGRELLAQAAKDGALYLIDVEHLGRMHDRAQAIDFCGTADDECRAFWAGTFVTQPVVSEIDGEPLVIAAGFSFDATHPAGIVAYKVVLEEGEPRFELAWQTPDFESPEAVARFRVHPSRPALSRHKGQAYVWVVEVGRAPIAGPGLLWGVRVSDGANVVRTPLTSEGVRYSKPLVRDDVIYVGSCRGNASIDGVIEAFRVE